ncbi:AraC family transcriptional regulator [Bdellovibrio sp. SKB1291214]|uniref:AraC family transcriptional regulator n=1 Tax=Bdellovibrio sp. SKB1291214 TaxID=1732569 RepID=UPI000B51B51F|nr:AraC family transcriptional regulator [Bdellovibrio sp. SKB1291214]UYL10289.1 AraC family transcriptional regulator [Bdellovibrio sp. SKB1291214]
MSKVAKLSHSQELEAIRDRLDQVIADFAAVNETYVTPIPWLSMAKTIAPVPPMAHIYEPSLCICVRGRKKVLIGKDFVHYDAKNYFISCIEMPTIISIAKASPKVPYMGIAVRLELEMVRSIIAEMEISGTQVEHSESAIAIRPVTTNILEPVLRAAILASEKKDISIMAPLLQREIYYRLLSGPSGDRLRQFAQLGSQTNRVSKAVNWIRDNFQKKMSIEDLAKMANMGVSTFHRHFSEITTMSPIQYQKNLRLHEARRLMITEDLDAATSAMHVGYESVTQFNREYRRLFGQPPATHKKKIIGSDMPTSDSVV